jgi:multiple sugar transport system ATP-binding protein
VEYLEHLGEASYLYATTPGAEDYLVVRQNGDVPCHRSDTLALTFPSRHCHLFDERGRAFPRILDEDSLPDRMPNGAPLP